MRYLYACFKGYIGFYNGLGLDKLEIDFKKAQHKITIISGVNGCGKSTLLNALNPFPDPLSVFMENKEGRKILQIANDSDIYDIDIISAIDAKGSRKTTKAYIKKNGLELNENGNVSSYKDIIFSEFDLDSNYLSLAQLSSDQKGLGDKPPAERKKFVSGIINDLEVYNQMYKTLNKKALIFKSHINNLHTKIQNIGVRENLESMLNSLRYKETEIKNSILASNNEIVAIQARSNVTEDESREYIKLVNDRNQLQPTVDDEDIKLNKYYHDTKISNDNIEDKYNEDKNTLSNYKVQYSSILSSQKIKSDRLVEVNNSVNTMRATIESSNSNNEDNVGDFLAESTKRLKEYTEELYKEKVPTNSTSLIPQLTNLISFYNRFIQSIDHFYDGLSSEDINIIISIGIENAINNCREQLSNILNQIEQKKDELIDKQSDLKALAILENRPDNCKINTCPFIADSLSIRNRLGSTDITEVIEAIQRQISDLSLSSSEIQSNLDHMNSLVSKSVELDAIRSSITEFIPTMELFNEHIDLDNGLLNMSRFDNQRDPSRLQKILNLLILYREEDNNNQVLKAKYDAFRDKIQLLNSSKSMLEKLEKEKEELIPTIQKINQDREFYSNIINELQDKITVEESYYNLYKKYKEHKSLYDQINAKIEIFDKKSSKSIEELKKVDYIRSQINNLNQQLNPITNQISSINGQLTLLSSYENEYNNYKAKFDYIEEVKKFCSPTNGGIQTIFMQMYMNKTMTLTNQILSMLFQGGLKILDFIINDKEFRIPFIGEGLPVEDISYGSNAQVSMMSMIINLVLLYQGSTKYNIASLDELDSMLDSRNRSQFVQVLYKSIDILNINQLFIISHSIETETADCDIIRLKQYQDYESSVQSGNIIYDYEATNK